MNVELEYLYRDAANYKLWGSAIYPNSAAIKLEVLEARIRAALIDGAWFIAEEIGLPPLKFETLDQELDHGWHEFHSLSESTDDEACVEGCDIRQVIEALEQSRKINMIFA